MSEITVNSGTIADYRGIEATLKLRIYVKKTFTTSDLEALVAGRIHSPYYYRELACTVAAGIVTYPLFTIDSTTDGVPDSSSYLFALYTDAGLPRGTVYPKIYVPPTPTTTSLGALAIYSEASPVTISDANYVLLVSLINALFAAIARATVSVYGLVKTSYASLSANQPIVVENNDPIIRAMRETVYLESYGHTQAGCTAAIAAIGSTPTVLEVTDPVTISSNTTFHANTLVVRKGNGAFSVNTGITLTLTLDPAAPPVQIFSGVGSAIVRGSRLRLEWWAGQSNSGDCTTAFTQAAASLTNNNGGILKIGLGVWKMDGVSFTSSMPGARISGSGSGINASQATVIKPFSTSAIDVFTFLEAFRNITVENLTLSTDGTVSTSSRAWVAKGTSPNTAIGLNFKNVLFHSTLAGSTTTHVDDLGGGWECAQVTFDSNCKWITVSSAIAPSKAFRCDTVNSTFLFDHPSFEIGVAGTVIYGDSIGFTEIISPDVRGVQLSAPTKTLDRTVTATTTSGLPDITITAGVLSLNDMGSNITSARISGNIIAIGADGLTATIDANASSTGSTTVTINRYSPNGGASVFIHLINGHGEINVHGGADEGFQYYLINDAGENLHPINFWGITCQSRIQGNAPCVLNLWGGGYLSQTISDASMIAMRITAIGCYLDKTSINSLGGTLFDLDEPRWWDQHIGVSIIQNDFCRYEGGLVEQYMGWPLRAMFSGEQSGSGLLDVAAIGAYSPADTFAGPDHKRLIEYGRANPVTERPDHVYFFGRNGLTGRSFHNGSQERRYKGYDFDADVFAWNFVGKTVSVDEITADLNNYIPADSSQFLLMSSDASRNITGLLYEFPAQGDGHSHEFWNEGSFPIVLKHESASSSAANRFRCDTGVDIILYPGERVSLAYLATFGAGDISRWLVSKIGAAKVFTSYLAATVTYNNTAALADTALSIPVAAGGIYDVELTVHSTNGARGLNMDFGGTATITNFIGQWTALPLVTFTGGVTQSVTAAGTDFGPTTGFDSGFGGFYTFKGSVEINAAGTFLLRGAQNSAHASNTLIVRGSILKLVRTN